MEVFLILFLMVAIPMGVLFLINSHDKAKYGRTVTLDNVMKEQENKKYNNFTIECPMCHSNRVTKIGTTSRVISVGAFGLASNKIGKQFECERCKYKF